MVKRLIVLVALLLSTVVVYADGQSLQGHKLPAYFNTTANLNIRESPNNKGKKITTLPKHTELYVIRLAENDFCKVKYNDITAYASVNYLSFGRDAVTPKHAIFEGGLIRQGEGLKEFIWNLTVFCYRGVSNLLGELWCSLVGLALLIIGIILLIGIKRKQVENGEDSIMIIGFLIFTGIFPIIISDLVFPVYNHNKVGGWIGTIAFIISFLYILLLHPEGSGIKGILVAILAFLFTYFGLVLSLQGVVKYVILGVFLIGIVFGGFSNVGSGSSSSSSYESDSYGGRNGDSWLPGEYGSDDKGDYVDDNTFVKNNGDTYYRHSNGDWHSWRE